MQDKKVIKFTREGIREENLATGDTKILTLSHYGRELKYSTDGEPGCYTEHSKNIHRHPAAYRQGNRRTCYSIAKRSAPEWDGDFKRSDQDGSTKHTSLPPEAKSRSNGSRNASSKSNTREPQGSSGRSQNSSKVGVSGKLRTHISNCRSMLLSSSESSSKDLKDNDNLGLSALGGYSQTAIKVMRGSSKRTGILLAAAKSITNPTISKSIQESDNLSLSLIGSSTKIKSVIQSGIRWTKRAIKLIKMAKQVLSNPAVLKFLAIAGLVILVIVIIFQMSTSFMAVLKGTTTEHPELTEYVEQLDSEFLNKIDALKAQYEQDDNTTVKIEGDEQINTDPNVLAIMATGDWVVIDLTPENRAKLENCHGLLNTYSVTKTDEKVKEEIPASSGSTTIKTKTIHHITIQVRVYSPEEIISKCGYTDAQQKNVLDMLDFLDQMTGETGNTPNTTTSGYYPVGDGEFQWPVPGHSYISSGYGTRIDPITRTESTFHTGLDIPAATGTSVLASADGTVIRAGWNSGFGNCVIIQHKNGVQTLYGHNSALVVKKGDVVRQGQVIAKVGSTGRSTGPHCHFEFRIKGHCVDPAPYLKGATR